jgi:tryptophan-rich sensory protein
MQPKKIIQIIVCLLIPIIVGGIAGGITANEIGGWYTKLLKPTFNPPNYLFGPVWTVLYILMGVSLYMIWRTPPTPARTRALVAFGVQLFFNFWWSIVFFSFHALFIAIINIVLMWIAIVYMILLFKKIKPAAAYINLPYLAWVSFATALNIAIWWLNK